MRMTMRSGGREALRAAGALGPTPNQESLVVYLMRVCGAAAPRLEMQFRGRGWQLGWLPVTVRR